MECYFHHQQNCFLDCFSDPLQDGLVIYVGGILFWNSEKVGTYTEVFVNTIGNSFWAASRYHEFLPSHKDTVLHTSADSSR